MTLEKYRCSGEVRYKLDGKRIKAQQAHEILAANPDINFVDNTIQLEICPDRLAAIRQIEEKFSTTFFIDHTVKIDGDVFAHSDNGAELELRDDCVKVTNGKAVTVYELDIAESRFIAELNAATVKAIENGTELEVITITGNSGKVYTYDAKTLEVIGVEEVPVSESAEEKPEEKLVEYIISQRLAAQAEAIKNCREKQVA